MAAPLNNRQKAYLSQLSDRAFNRLAAQARGRGEDPAATLGAALDSQLSSIGLSLTDILPPSVPTSAFSLQPLSFQRSAFRHAHVALATGKLGLRCCSQDDYKRVEARLLDLLGEPGKALNAHLRAETNTRRQVAWKIRQRCKEYGIPTTKAEGICRQMTKGQAGLDDADEVKLWNVYFKLRYYEPKAA